MKERDKKKGGRKDNHGAFCSSAMNTYCHNKVNANAKYGFN